MIVVPQDRIEVGENDTNVNAPGTGVGNQIRPASVHLFRYDGERRIDCPIGHMDSLARSGNRSFQRLKGFRSFD